MVSWQKFCAPAQVLVGPADPAASGDCRGGQVGRPMELYVRWVLAALTLDGGQEILHPHHGWQCPFHMRHLMRTRMLEADFLTAIPEGCALKNGVLRYLHPH